MASVESDVNCGVCAVKCTSSSIQCTKCTKWYHSKCVKITIQQLNHFNKEIKQKNGERWVCDRCGNLEVRNPENQNKRKKLDEPEGDEEKQWSLNDIMLKLFEMDRKYMDLMSKYQQQVEVNNELRVEIADLKRKLKTEINKSEQRELKNNIIVKGLPSSATEDSEVIKKMGRNLQVTLGKIKTFRLGKGTNSERPVPLKVCFENEQEKINFIKAQKKKRLTTENLGYQESNNIYVDHDLTRTNQELYKEARKYKKENNFQFIWIRDGKIFLRKDEKSKAMLIEDLEDLKN